MNLRSTTPCQARPAEGEAPAAVGTEGAIRAGAMAMVPLIVGLIPFGLTVGATAAKSSAPLVGWASSILLYGGSGQLALLGALDSGASVTAAVLATILVNAQMVLLGTGLRSRWREHPMRWRLSAAYLIVGPLLAATAAHDQEEPDAARRRAFTLGAGGTLWVCWLGLTSLGMAVGAALAGVPWLGLVTPLVMLAMGLKATADRTGVVALAVGASVSLATCPHWPEQSFVLGGAAGVCVGLLVRPRSVVADPGTDDEVSS